MQGDGEANHAHFALQRLKIDPYALYPDKKLDPERVRAFIYASISVYVDEENKRRKEAEKKAKKGR